ncbi:MAG TPA: type I DNA topoisomerase [Candidatus Cloacimonetes bacterium]|nr:type I DNA topoisomerase [Candidatus Cloacimonadota bacterium]HEX37351.1 type I DNA topoisomerase [Candidatus Cloacimonadota bacterium]
MAKNLVIVESPTKSKTIGQYLGKDFTILASMGHIRDLPQKDFGINIKDNFKPTYVLDPKKQKIVKKIRDAAKESDNIYLASDNDREGEAIAWHLKEILKNTISDEDIYRIVFNEITKDAILDAIENPAHVDENKVEAQQARRILDRIVGYKVSPILWKVITKKLSAGRVQTVALRLLCEREQEIRDFVPKEYWSIDAELKKEIPFNATLKKYNGKTVKLNTKEEAEEIFDKLASAQYTVYDVKKSEKSQAPFPPFITSTLQQEASKLLGFTTKKTMQIAQQLYEGVTINNRNTGLISYMRTDSVRIGEKANFQLRKYIKDNYPEEYLCKYLRVYKNKNKAQDAHEAIRPTNSFTTPDSIKEFLTKDQYKLYSLIWKRFAATQMANMNIQNITAHISAEKGLFETQASSVLFEGFSKVYPYMPVKNLKEKFPDLIKGDNVELIKLDKKQHFTQPPPRFTEASLVRKLEEKGIGRPSTYAPIISTLLLRKYVELKKKVFYPTELGETVEKFLIEKFEDFFNVKFTADMESKLDDIENGERNWIEILEHYYDDFIKSIDSIDISKEKKKYEQKTDILCDKCGSPMVIKFGKYGKFLACSAFPKCKNVKSLDENEKIVDETTDEKCPKCGGKILFKNGRYGKFFACENYPTCKYTRPYTIGVKCPECKDGDLIERKGKKNKLYYTCSKYPDCKFTTNKKPVAISCPDCGAPSMFEKSSRKKVKILVCEKCGKEIAQ